MELVAEAEAVLDRLFTKNAIQEWIDAERKAGERLIGIVDMVRMRAIIRGINVR
jgi:hypothetical protein